MYPTRVHGIIVNYTKSKERIPLTTEGVQAKDNVIPAFIIRMLIVMAPTFIPTNIKDQNRRAMKIELIFKSGSLVGKQPSTAENLFQSIARAHYPNLNSNKIYDSWHAAEKNSAP